MSSLVGQEAPDFTLKNQFGQEVTLSDYRGKKNVVLVFFPMAFTGICTDELCELRDRKQIFESEDVQVLGISCDSSAAQKVFADQEGISYPLLADYWPHGAVASSFGSFNEQLGFAIRGTFVIDKLGIVRWAVINGPGEARNADDYESALANLD
ncbi:MAG: peroxiredoxin [Actinobacteria bacterium]|nr:peroxiredoxin [Actinomycetota bacterium]NBY15434.1 peroxiredoxin [Actinomycetota bacterium]